MDALLEISFLGLTILIVFIMLIGGYLTSYYLRLKNSFSEKTDSMLNGLSIGIIIFLIFDFLEDGGFFGIDDTDYSATLLLISVFVGYWLICILVELKIGGEGFIYLWAVALGLHGFAEGISSGYNLLLSPEEILLFFPILSFAIHKFTEGFTGGTLLNKPYNPSQKKAIILACIAAVPFIPGILFGYYNDLFTNIVDLGSLEPYFYSASMGGLVFILTKFMKKRLSSETPDEKELSYPIWVMAGFLFLLVAAIFHNIGI